MSARAINALWHVRLEDDFFVLIRIEEAHKISKIFANDDHLDTPETCIQIHDRDSKLTGATCLVCHFEFISYGFLVGSRGDVEGHSSLGIPTSSSSWIKNKNNTVDKCNL